MKKNLAVLAGLLAIVLAACSAPVIQHDHIAVQRPDKTLSMDEMDRAIHQGAAARGWEAKTVSPGHITATMNDSGGAQQAVVDIQYDPTEYSVHYVSSKGLKYDAAQNRIRRNYNSWVTDLIDSINNSIRFID